MLKGLTDWNTATSKVFVTNHKCKFIEIDCIIRASTTRGEVERS